MTAPAMAAVHADQPALAASPARPAPQTAASQITSATPITTGARYALAVTVAIAARLVCVRRPARPAAKAAERNTRNAETAVAPQGINVMIAAPRRAPTPLLSSHIRVPVSTDWEKVPDSADNQPRTTVPATNAQPARALSSPAATATGNHPSCGDAASCRVGRRLADRATWASSAIARSVRRGDRREAIATPC